MKRHLFSGWIGKVRWVNMVLILAAVLSFGSAQPAAASAPSAASATWQLVDYHQSACFSPRVTTNYYGIWINGTWTHQIKIGIKNLPAGGTYWTSGAPIPPGSSDGVYSLAYVAVQLPSTTPVGVYTASLWASDGTIRQRVPVTLNVKARCGY